MKLRILGLSSNGLHRVSSLFLIALAVALLGCQARQRELMPAIQITRAPVASLGGPKAMDDMEGKVSGARAGDHVVLYAFSEVWWIQPFKRAGLTDIQPDSTWRNSSHLGTDYAALLVEPGYHPALKPGSIAAIGNGVLATAVVKGGGPAVVPKTIHFSGYDWTAQTADNDTAGETQSYDPDNAWVDEKGLTVEGKQYSFLREGMWRSDVPPRTGMTVDVGFDPDGAPVEVYAVSESQIAKEQAQKALDGALRHGGALGASVGGGLKGRFGPLTIRSCSEELPSRFACTSRMLFLKSL